MGKAEKERNLHQININEVGVSRAEQREEQRELHVPERSRPAVAAVPGESGRQPEGGARWKPREAAKEKKQEGKDEGR